MDATRDDLIRLGERLYGSAKKVYAPSLARLFGITERHMRRLLGGHQELSALRRDQIEELRKLASRPPIDLDGPDQEGDDQVSPP